ncbi:MAG: pentapeptide repeat-containing protein, partial [Pseudomonadota bacterium]
MANPQHLEWLKEGVASWNRRRHDLVFFPDLADANLQGAILHGADLREADLQRANLKEANLTMADLREADLREADLLDANLTMADLREADVRTLKDPGTSKIVSGAANYTNLSRCRKLTQAQLGRMLGDSGTILPDHLTRPEHWSDLDPETTTTTNENNKIAQPPEPETSNPEPNTGTATLNARVIFHLRHARTASLTAETVAQLLDAEVTVQRQTTNQIGPEIDLLEELVETLRGFSTATSASNPVPSDLER